MTEILLKQEAEQAQTELSVLEAELKASYNAYVDSLCNYIERLNLFNEMRKNRINSLVEKSERDSFVYRAVPPLESNASKYLLDRDACGRATPSLIMVQACSSESLLERKAE
jgi:hypothetical protein